jgi:hypothetical protein
MGILKYIPKKKNIIDRRSDDGGYYEAECDVCGTIYYPKRSNGKYCSHSCSIRAYRERVQKGTVNLKPKNLVIENKDKQWEDVYSGSRLEVGEYIKKKYNVNKGTSKTIMVDTDNESYIENFLNSGFRIYKRNSRIYEVEK